jgi:hypothetical protein
MPNRRTNSFIAPAWLLLFAGLVVLLGVTSYVVLSTRQGHWLALWREAPISGVRPELGVAFIGATGRPDLSSHEGPSPAIVTENGTPLGPSNAQHADIREKGRGHFSFWHESIYFSASDNTDPRTNGRRYAISYPPIGRGAARTLYGATVAGIVGLAVACLFVLPLRELASASVHRVREIGRVTIEVSQQQLSPSVGRRSPAAWLLRVWALPIALVAIAFGVYSSASGSWTTMWREVALTQISPELGHAYISPTGRESLSSHLVPSVAVVLEDGRPLSSGNMQHDDIRKLGQGRFSFWHNALYFSTSDNTDPRSNGRRYTISFPPVTGGVATAVYLTALIAAGLAFALSLAVLPSSVGFIGRAALSIKNFLMRL